MAEICQSDLHKLTDVLDQVRGVTNLRQGAFYILNLKGLSDTLDRLIIENQVTDFCRECGEL